MEVSAKLRGARISAQKARLVADQVRGMPVEEALSLLEFSTKKARSIWYARCLTLRLLMPKTMRAQTLTSCVYRRFLSMRASP